MGPAYRIFSRALGSVTILTALASCSSEPARTTGNDAAISDAGSSDAASAGETTVVDGPQPAQGEAATGEAAVDAVAGSCPASEPNALDPCTWPAALQCAYRDPCPFFGCQDTFTCVAGHYQALACAYALNCPATAPKDGDSCACGAGHSAHHYGEGQPCNFACADGALIDAQGQLTAVCDLKTEKWIVTAQTTCMPITEGGAQDVGGDASADATATCTGRVPSCFGNDANHCCGQDPAGQARCSGETWMCGAAPAPGCNGTRCLAPSDAGPG